MAESSYHLESIDKDRELVVERAVTEDDASGANATAMDEFDREMSEGTLQTKRRLLKLPKFCRKTVGSAEDMKMPLLSESTDKDQSSSWCLPLQSLSLMSETELQKKRVEILFYLLSDLNLEDYAQRYRVALQMNVSFTARQVAQQGDYQVETAPSIAEIDDLTTTVIGMINNLARPGGACTPLQTRALQKNSWEVALKAFMLLIANDEFMKPTFDLLEAFDTEKKSILSSFYSDCRHLENVMTVFSTCIIIGQIWSDSIRRIREENSLKRSLAHLCEALAGRILRLAWYNRSALKYAGDVLNMGKKFALDGKYLHAVFAFFTAAELHKVGGGNARSLDITKCVDLIRLVVERMGERPLVVENHVIPLMKSMRSFLDTKNANEKAVVIVCKARCSNSIGYCYYVIGEREESFQQFSSAVQLIEDEFEGKTVQLMRTELDEKERLLYEAYGKCLNNVAFVCYKMGVGSLDKATGARLIKKASGMCGTACIALGMAKNWEQDEARKICQENASLLQWKAFLYARRRCPKNWH